MATIRDLAIGEVITPPSPATSGTTLTLDTGQGDDMPTTTPFKVLAFPQGVIPDKYNSEQLTVTDVTGDVLTIVRAQGETTAQSIAAGWMIANSIFAEDFATSSFKVGQTPSGSINGSNTAFTTPDYYVASTLKVYLNGQSLVAGASDDFVETSTGFTMNYAPATGDKLRVDYLTSDSLNLMATDSMITGQLPSGSINSSNTVFTTASPYSPGSLRVYKNGVRLYGGGEDYTETSPTLGTFTMVSAPVTGARLVVDYIITGGFTTTGSNSFVHGETPTGTVDSSNTSFTTVNLKYVPNSLEVFINGIAQKRGTDFIETTPASGVFTLSPAPTTGDVVLVNYQFAASVSANADTVDGFHASDLMPVGAVIPYAGTNTPSTSWLFCYGQAVSRTTYSVLFTALGTTYGTGDGSTTFNLPDMRGRVPAGQDDMGGSSANRLTGVTGSVNGDTLGGTGGAETHTLVTAEMPAHTHAESVGNGTPGASPLVAQANYTGGNFAVGNTTASTGGDGAHNNVQPTIILNYIIKAV